MAIVWQRTGKIVGKEIVMTSPQTVGQKEITLGCNTLAYNTETGIVGTIQYHKGDHMWVLEISRCKNIQSMTHCDSIVTEQSEDRIELIAALKEAVEQSFEDLLFAA